MIIIFNIFHVAGYWSFMMAPMQSSPWWRTCCRDGCHGLKLRLQVQELKYPWCDREVPKKLARLPGWLYIHAPFFERNITCTCLKRWQCAYCCWCLIGNMITNAGFRLVNYLISFFFHDTVDEPSMYIQYTYICMYVYRYRNLVFIASVYSMLAEPDPKLVSFG